MLLRMLILQKKISRRARVYEKSKTNYDLISKTFSVLEKQSRILASMGLFDDII